MKNIKHVSKDIVKYIIALIITIFTLYPLIWMITFSVRKDSDILTVPPKLIPTKFIFENYIKIWNQGTIPKFFINSLYISIITAVIIVAISCIAAYGLSRFKFKGKTIFSFLVLSSQLFPTVIIMVPLFLFFNAVKLYDNQLALIISYIAIFMPFSIFLLLGFFNTIPKDLEEAAYIDGASRMGAFIRIVLPNVSTGLSAVGLFAFIGAWQEFLFALTFITTESKKTLPIGLLYFFGQYKADYAGLMAASVIASLPSIILFLILQKYMVKGFLGGAIKG
jgi:multiple sugar transport system permease protein